MTARFRIAACALAAALLTPAAGAYQPFYPLMPPAYPPQPMVWPQPPQTTQQQQEAHPAQTQPAPPAATPAQQGQQQVLQPAMQPYAYPMQPVPGWRPFQPQPFPRIPVFAAPPGTPAWAPAPAPAQPSARTGAAQNQQQAVQAQPRLEIDLEAESAYVHQNLVLSVDIVSDVSLGAIAVDLPDTDTVIFRQLDDLNVHTVTRDAKREVIHRQHYQLTPLRSGDIDLPPIKVSGSRAGLPFELGWQGTRLRVLPPRRDVRPWLPLHDLELSVWLDNDEEIVEGMPLTLIIEQRAVGLTGAQLPSPESQLRSPHHRLYLEKTETDGQVSKEGRLVGTRTDRYTLVPQKGDHVQIPAIKVDWWHVDRERKETALVPARLLNAQDGMLIDESSPADGTQLKWQLWMAPLLAVSFLAGVYWRVVKRLLLRAMPAVWSWLERATRPQRKRLMNRLLKLSPRRHLHVARRWFADTLPRSWRLWFCVRSADNEDDPDDWNQVLRFLVSRRLDIPAQQSHARLTRQIIEIHPHADPDRLRTLMKELEQAVFGHVPIADFDRWKRDFKSQIRPRLFVLRLPRQSRSRHALPALNPET